MKAYLDRFFAKFEYPQDDAETINFAYSAISENSVSLGMFLDIYDIYCKNINCDYENLIARCDTVASLCAIHPYTVYLLTFICLSKQLKENYHTHGIDEEIWVCGMYDLKYKMIECKKAKGVCGTFVPTWYKGFFNMTRFALGRLQFEIKPFGRTYEKNGKKLLPTSPAINIHIPQTGTPLDKASRLDAYDKARAFFADAFTDSPMAFMCHTWMLYEKNREWLKEGSNIRSFMDDFDIIETDTVAEGKCPFAWLVFGMEYTGDPEKLPENSSLQKAYKDALKKGERLGRGYGVFFA